MKQITHILIIMFFISCSNKSEQKQNKIETHIKPKIIKNTVIEIDTAKIGNYYNELKEWLGYYKKKSLKLENFDFVIQNNLPNIFATVDTFDLINDIYKPFYKYSPDSSKVLDFTSYNILLEKNDRNELVSIGGDIDSEVSIKDLKKKLWQRLLFVGSLSTIEDGFWINNNQLLIVGNHNDLDQEKFKPSIWFVDLKTNIIQSFEYKNYINKTNYDYFNRVKYKDIKWI